ncbi:MAG: hypothetical protein FWH28_02025 [Clostridiales bacterium]|nr:hypothetical protein [Clostridiales bacterium]
MNSWFAKNLFRVLCAFICICIVAILLITVSWLPAFGDPDSPTNNEVSAKYLEDGVEDTGAVNIVAGMILDYRAFDTFGETCVLFVAVCAIVALMQDDRKPHAMDKPSYASERPRQDAILRTTSLVQIPMIMIFGFYVILNGHLSPGGGFSGGAILGSALILHANVYGVEHASRFLSFKVYRRTVSVCLIFYALAKGYSIYTGANHIRSVIPLGTPGKLLSAGLIMPLNIAVGLVVACTVYIIYILFSKGDEE